MSDSLGCCGSLLPGLAAPVSHTLANGVELVQLDLEDAPLVCLDFWCRAGSAFETPTESGLAHFLEHMVFKGSDGLAAGEFDRRIEALGGSSNAATGFDDVHFHALMPPEGAAEALDLLMDLVLQPRLDPDSFTMERQVVLEELAQSEDQPEEVALQRLLSLACPDHPYGLPILGRRQALLDHDPAAMAAFHHRQYAAGRCVLSLAGAVGDGALMERAASGPLAALAASGAPMVPAQLSVTPGVHRLAVPRLEAARLLMLWWLPPAADQEAMVGADLGTTVLAEGRRSRLVERLREQLQIVESIDMDLHAMEGGSIALLEAVCDPEELGEVRQAIEQVWQELRQEALGAQEWGRARRLVANGYRFSLESPGGVASLIGSSRLWGRPQPLGQPLELLDRWSPQRLQEQMLPLLDPARACVLEAVPA
ncbi:insulinase family protein [Cyanobium sp. N.Huapi 1H5]|uniref:M16 family metallopeptidase n=1 Tax=Cyanobium sp. N.Huapi 1H5 TaxID=2823719 RepID=UPI0020CCB5CF|nr:pitrilysin family protein [Cyanobium sp. N.Huapi 1H5]MCP9836912.1 insulinase family protein [Cyanobium sp. N.Huapi 1H5]